MADPSCRVLAGVVGHVVAAETPLAAQIWTLEDRRRAM